MSTIRFYGHDGRWGCFSNFSPHGFTLGGVEWRTAEHYFQAMKFAGTPYADEIRRAKSPMAAKRMGQSRKHPLRRDWERAKDDVMRTALAAKFDANEDARETLLETSDATLVEDAPHDAYWGSGRDGRGRNRLGTLLMEVRARLRASSASR
jgi:ribA/ribD-fused uncharacterized protein